MKNKIQDIVKNIQSAVTFENTEEVTDFLHRTNIFIPFDKNGKICVKKDDFGILVPVYMENKKSDNFVTKEFTVLSVLVFLSENDKVDGLDFIYEDKSIHKVVLTNDKFIN